MRFATMALVCLATAAQADTADLPALHDVTGVAADDELQVRSGPSANDTPVTTLAPDARSVEVVSLSEDGKWANVNAGETSGWVATRFLAAQPDTAWWQGNVPLHCLGTEPFWGIGLNLAEKTAVYSALDGIDKPMSIDRVWTHFYNFPASATVGIRFADRNAFATLQAETCSDGMSDRSYGIAIDLFLTDDENLDLGWSGCCTITP